MIKDGFSETERNKAVAYIQGDDNAWQMFQAYHAADKEKTERIKSLLTQIDQLEEVAF